MIASRALLAPAFCILFLSPAAAPVLAQVAPESPPVPPVRSGLPRGMELIAGSFQQTEAGDIIVEGAPTIRWKESRFQADRIVIRKGRYVEAEGNVLVVWGGNRVFGSRMTYDLEADRGTVENAIGQMEPEFYFSADKVEKVGEDRIFLVSATITTCTQPVPYWSFSVSSAKVRLNHYARMWNLALKTKKLPVFYLPYMIWPVKRDRSAGLLFPNFGTTENRGSVISQALFVPLGRSADLELIGEYYTKAGFGAGGVVRLVPNRDGTAVLNGFFIDDKVAGFSRWRASYRQTQKFRNGFRMVADINEVSDFDYFSDFERDLRLVSSPTILGRIELARNGRWNSVNVRELRREQLVAGGTLVQQTLPELEFRGRSRRLGKTPVYLSYESSLTTIQQQGATIDADYYRADLTPTISVPVSPVPWLDVNPQIAYRVTWYSQSRDPEADQPLPPPNDGLTLQAISDRGLVRQVAAAGLEIVGPKIQRIFERKGGIRFKHLLEPRITYAFRDTFAREDEVIRFDSVDLILPRNLLTYGIRSRLFARRPQARPTPPAGGGEAILMPDGRPLEPAEPQPDLRREGLPPTAPEGVGPSEPLEIATLEIAQNRSFDDTLSCADLDGDDIADRTSQTSNVQITGRFNPNPGLSFDLRSQFHTLYKQIQDVSLSGNVRRPATRLGFSLVHRRGRSCAVSGTQFFPQRGDNDTQLRLNAGLTLFRGKLRLDVDGSFNANPPTGQKKVPDRRIRMEYYTQCCGFLAEYLARDFSTTGREEFRFTVDLRGIGKFLDLHHGVDR